ncbi:unnamed protein product [Rotaria sp. Silwood1]|nr:unnamed protein product [Rotaria sp. Silwood1]CAF5108470.1 unnamed protein product [Rotaria sp. Silwood1]
MPITQVIIGSLYLNSCPVDDRIPKYLIIAGVGKLICFAFAIIKETVSIICAKKRVQYSNPYDTLTYCEYLVITCVTVTLFFSYGSVIGVLGYPIETEK